MKENVKEKKPVSVKQRVAKTHAKAEFVGILYLIGTVFLAVMAFLPLIYGTSVGKMSVVNFWKPILALKDIKGSSIPVAFNAGVAILYAILLISVVINVIRCLSRLGRLFKKKASRINGFNRNAMAMEEMGKIFSGTYCVLIVFTFMIHLITGAGFTNLFYFAVIIGLIVHFWGGLVGGNVSMFTVGKDVEEEKRTLGRVAPFFRNIAQLVFVGLIMYFISQTNLMLNALKWLEKGAFTELFKGPKMDLVYYGIIPGVQILICIWTVVLLKHATASTEFHREGMEAPGMKNFRVFSIFLLITAGALFGFMCFASTKRDFVAPQMGTLYIAIIALAALIEEFCMCRLPNVKGKVVEEEPAEGEESEEYDPFAPQSAGAAADEGNEGAAVAGEPAPAPVIYRVPLQCISQPGVFMQPNGQPVMMMPMIAGPQTMPVPPVQAPPAPPAEPAPQPQPQPQSMYSYANPYANPYMNPYANPFMNPYGPNAYWVNGQPYQSYNPYQYVQEQPAEEPEKQEQPAEPAEKPLTVKERKANLAADRKSLRAEASLAKKESKAAAEKEAVEKALADKWMKKAKAPVAAESGIAANAAAPAAAESGIAAPAVAPVPAPAPVQETNALVPVVQEPAKEAVMETYAYQNQPSPVAFSPRYPEASGLTEEDLEKPLPPKKWTVTCPDCATKLTVKDGAFAYRCPECGGVFQLRKIYRARQNNQAQ